MEHIAVIGAGECGGRAALTLRSRGFEGEITLIGAEPIAPYERPPLSKPDPVTGREPRFIVSLQHYQDHRIALLLGVSATNLDPAERTIGLSDGRALVYDKLLLATGAYARPFPGVDAPAKRIHVLRTHADALALHAACLPGRHIVIIGGGFIGLEVAAAARKSGADVTIVEGLPRILSRGVPAAIADVVARRHRQEGVDIRCGQAIARISDEEDKAAIYLADGDLIDADLVLVGIGAVPDATLAKSAGLAIDNGIAVNDRLETSAPDIYAAGDCCSVPLALYDGRRVRLESWRNAQDHGILAAANLLGAGERVSAVPWFWSDQYDLTLQIAGLADGATTALRRDLGDDAFILFHIDETGRLLAASGIGRGNAVARDIRLAEMLIAARARPEPDALVASHIKLKSLLAA